MSDIRYDDSNLQRLFSELAPKRRKQALKGAFRKAAKKVRSVAVQNLRSSMNSDRDLERGIRALIWKRKAGFRVTVGTKRAGKNGKGEAGYWETSPFVGRNRNEPAYDKNTDPNVDTIAERS